MINWFIRIFSIISEDKATRMGLKFYCSRYARDGDSRAYTSYYKDLRGRIYKVR